MNVGSGRWEDYTSLRRSITESLRKIAYRNGHRTRTLSPAGLTRLFWQDDNSIDRNSPHQVRWHYDIWTKKVQSLAKRYR